MPPPESTDMKKGWPIAINHPHRCQYEEKLNLPPSSQPRAP